MENINRDNFISLIDFIYKKSNFLKITKKENFYLIETKGQNININIFYEDKDFDEKYFIKLFIDTKEKLYHVNCDTPDEKLTCLDNKLKHNESYELFIDKNEYIFNDEFKETLLNFFK